MDIKGTEGWLLSAIGTVVAALFGAQAWSRRQSAGKLANAEDSASIEHVQQMKRDRDAWQLKYESLLERYMTARDGLAEERASTKILKDHVMRLTQVVIQEHPKDADWLQESGFMDMNG